LCWFSLSCGAALKNPQNVAVQDPSLPAPAVQVDLDDQINPQSIDLTADLPIDPEVTLGKLENGLTYYIRRNEKPENRAEFWLIVNAGSLQEDGDQLGLAHFLEHMAFNGTAHFKKQDLVDYLERIGMRFGPDVNAFTSFDETVYTLRVPTDKPEIVKTALQILEDWTRAISLDEEEIDKERGVVIEEWRLGRGAEARMRDQQFPVLFQESRYADRLPIGKKEILEEAPYEALRRFYRDWYRPDLMAVVAVGDFDTDSIEEQIRTHFGTLKNPKAPRIRESYPVPDHDDTLFAITTDPEATLTMVGVYQKLPRRDRPAAQDYRASIVEQTYHGLLNARLDELRQQADPPFLFAGSTSGGFVRSKDVFYQAAGVKDGALTRGFRALLSEVERVKQHGFTASELDRLKLNLLRTYQQAFEERNTRESASYASEYMRNFLEEEPSPGIAYELALVQRFLPTITLDEINSVSNQWISEKNRVILVSGPDKRDVDLPSKKDLEAAFHEVKQLPLEAFVDQVREVPILKNLPSAGAVISESFNEKIGLTDWRLANGVRVLLKPTDFKNDEILLRGFSPGGHSLVSDEDYVSATFAASIAGESGLGEFSRIELEKALAGKLATAQPFIGELDEGFSGAASPQDLETMLRLIYLSFTSPRRDEGAFFGFKSRLEAFVANRLARPEVVFSDAVRAALSQNHIRRRPPSPELLAELNLDRALEVYRERFSDASDFTFILVGNFQPLEIKASIETYLGGLPSTGRIETWSDIGVVTPTGVQRVVVNRGLEPKSRAQLIFTGPAEWSREGLHQIQSLAAGLRIRLRERLREDLGAVYGVSVQGSLIKRPRERYQFSIGFGCAPEKVQALIDQVFVEIDALKKDGLEASYIEKVQESQTRQRETDLKENSFWLGALGLYFDLDLDPELILDYSTLVAASDSAELARAANRYLDSENYLLGILNPENYSETE
jgi:zinc protease